jgi:hypothetical protein
MSLLCILTCFARVLRPGGTSWPTAGRWTQHCLAKIVPFQYAMTTRVPKNLPKYPCVEAPNVCRILLDRAVARRSDVMATGGRIVRGSKETLTAG